MLLDIQCDLECELPSKWGRVDVGTLWCVKTRVVSRVGRYSGFDTESAAGYCFLSPCSFSIDAPTESPLTMPFDMEGELYCRFPWALLRASTEDE